MSNRFDTSNKYSARHIPTSETWVLIGINEYTGRAFAAGWPPSIGRLEDFIDIQSMGALTDEELEHRDKYFNMNARV